MLEATQSLETKLADIQDAIQDTTQQSAARHREAKDTECLNHLCLTDPSADKLRIEEHKGGLFKDSYSWIIRHADFQQFLADPDMQLLWIKGAPGKGKTMLMSGIINELKSTGRLLSYFLCEQANSKMNSETAILRGLIFALATQQPLLLSHLRKKAPETANAVLLVDALDECATGQRRFLDFLLQCNQLKHYRVKWIVSSRNYWADIEERMRRMELKLQPQLELNQELVSDAIISYIAHKVNIVAGDKG
ncbi:hypothetical protein VHEMI02982 [[Torrubiella] hemipterigena]|uniref:NACHT domain-containing protein n=1 Tax=[Torrubiella] hemipterigena TaxID=1531966 RepID=A0A0A1SR63_9HYPO|nr:hypothetical protein VHEMI02982 [[Torrubiella] hemipterigena]